MSKTLFPLRGEGYEQVVLCGRFLPDTANPPTITEGAGQFTVVYGGVAGHFTVTLAKKYTGFVVVVPGLQLSAAAARSIHCGDFVVGSRTITIRVIDAAGAGQNIAANANNSVSFIAVVRKGRKSK